MENKVPVDDFQGLQWAEINQNECVVCLGMYDNNLTGGAGFHTEFLSGGGEGQKWP